LNTVKNFGDFRYHYRIGKQLSSGKYGDVRSVAHIKTGHEAAVKIYNKERMSPYAIDSLYNELTILKELTHPNTLKLYEFFED
jgi:calcium-dependent protein kinase